jgi:hypothetical protein
LFQIEKLMEKSGVLIRNISSLYVTAKAEMARKDNQNRELQSQYDNHRT